MHHMFEQGTRSSLAKSTKGDTMVARLSGFCYTFIRCLAFAVLVTAVSASAAVVNVSVVNNRFQPASVTIQVSDQVTWTWAASTAGVPHTTTSETPGLWDCGI